MAGTGGDRAALSIQVGRTRSPSPDLAVPGRALRVLAGTRAVGRRSRRGGSPGSSRRRACWRAGCAAGPWSSFGRQSSRTLRWSDGSRGAAPGLLASLAPLAPLGAAYRVAGAAGGLAGSDESLDEALDLRGGERTPS